MADGTVRCIDSEIPFDIPDSWGWVRLGSIFAHNSGKALNGNGGSGEPHPYLTTSNVYWNSFDLSKVKTMNFSNEELKKCSISKGDLLVCEGGDIGRAAIWCYDYEICIQNHLHRLRAYCPICTAFFYLVFLLYKGSGVIGGKGIGIQGLSSGALHNILLPFPPLSEQERIKSVVDRIEPNVAKYEELYNKYTSINKEIYDLLKKSILQEAIQGRLVPQIESEGTAEELLAKIRAEKQQLVKEGKLKKSALATESRIFRGDDNRYYLKNGTETNCIDDYLFDIPITWQWITLGELVVDTTGLSYKKEILTDRSEPFIRVLRGGNIEDGIMKFRDDDVFISAKYVPTNLFLTKGMYISPAVSSLEKIGKTAIVDRSYTDTVVGGFVLMLTPTFNDPELGRYLYYFFQSGFYQNYCRKITKKSGQAFYNLSRKKLVICPVPIPPKAELKRILSTLDKVVAGIMSR